METQVYFDSIKLDIAPWLGVISSCILGWIFQRLDTNTETEIYAMQFFQGYNSLLQ